MADVVGAGQIAVHAIEGCRFGRPQMRAAVFDLIPVKREDAAVFGNRRSQRSRAIGCGNRSGQMLEPVLDPFHRAAGRTRGRRDQNDVGEYALLDAKAAAGIRRRAQAQAIARNLQSARQHRMNAERALKLARTS